jgi:hypothetical protein
MVRRTPIDSGTLDEWAKAAPEEVAGRTALVNAIHGLSAEQEHQAQEIVGLDKRLGLVEDMARVMAYGMTGQRKIGNGGVQQLTITSPDQGNSARAGSSTRAARAAPKPHAAFRVSVVNQFNTSVRRNLQEGDDKIFNLDALAIKLGKMTDPEVAKHMTTTMVSFGGSDVTLLEALRTRGFSASLITALENAASA